MTLNMKVKLTKNKLLFSGRIEPTKKRVKNVVHLEMGLGIEEENQHIFNRESGFERTK